MQSSSELKSKKIRVKGDKNHNNEPNAEPTSIPMSSSNQVTPSPFHFSLSELQAIYNSIGTVSLPTQIDCPQFIWETLAMASLKLIHILYYSPLSSLSLSLSYGGTLPTWIHLTNISFFIVFMTLLLPQIS